MDKTVLITGCAKGIGRACIISFAKQGYNVVINYLTSKKEADDLKCIVERKYGVRALAIKADISNEREVISMMDETIKTFGKIDVLINNAAYVCDNPYFDKTKEEFLKVLEVNVVGTFLVTKHAVKHMNNGIIINVSSTDAEDTYNELNMDYCASKAGVNLLAKTFSVAVPNNRFISVMPPWVRTDSVLEMLPSYLESELKRTKQERLLEPVEVADKIFSLVDNNDVKSGSVIKLCID